MCPLSHFQLLKGHFESNTRDRCISGIQVIPISVKGSLDKTTRLIEKERKEEILKKSLGYEPSMGGGSKPVCVVRRI